MGSILLDTIKISLEPKYVHLENGSSFKDLFIADCQKNDCRAGKRMRKDLLPYAVEKIEYYEGKGEKPPIFEIKLSSKILRDLYQMGISEKTIHYVCAAINKIDGFYLQLEGLLKAQVHEVHVMANCLVDDPCKVMDALNAICCLNDHFTTYSRGGTKKVEIITY